MARNVEIKAFAPNFSDVVSKAKALATSEPTITEQADVFFITDRGRLKLRFLTPTQGKLIFYERADQAGPKTSTFSTYTTENPHDLRVILSAAYGEGVTVEKVRTQYLIGTTRVHLDTVKHLGQFVELEVVIEDGDTAESGAAEASRLMNELGILQEHLIDRAYVDLLTSKSDDQGSTAP